MLEAKGPGYADKMNGPNDWLDWYTGDPRTKLQMEDQSTAAVDWIIEWHFAEQAPAKLLSRVCSQKALHQHHCNPHSSGEAMKSERFRIEAYWRPRQESTRDCAGRLVHMLEGLAKANPAFGRWNKKAKTRAAANRPAWAMPPDLTELTAVFEKGRRFKDGRL